LSFPCSGFWFPDGGKGHYSSSPYHGVGHFGTWHLTASFRFHFRSGVQLLHRRPYCTVTYQKRGERKGEKKPDMPPKTAADSDSAPRRFLQTPPDSSPPHRHTPNHAVNCTKRYSNSNSMFFLRTATNTVYERKEVQELLQWYGKRFTCAHNWTCSFFFGNFPPRLG
jgi:hypothetical protein